MSGGVDSSVAAAILVEKGYQVIGMMLRLWSEPGRQDSNRCCTPDAMAMARRVSAQLDIPFYAINAQEPFRTNVVQYFLDGYAQGVTPNPCLVCNRTIRWEFLLNHALALGAGFMATGHYARIDRSENGTIQLLRAIDRQKDQSYVLHVLDQDRLSHALFPLGDYTKTQVRELAHRYQLPVADRSESQDLCFLAGDDYREFLMRHNPQVYNPGPILTLDGEALGEHRGLAFYTIGQRKGLGISHHQPLYVLEKDTNRNALIVDTRGRLDRTECIAGQINWVSGDPLSHPMEVNVKVRYQARDVRAVITPFGDKKVHVNFLEPARDISPGQAAVFYNADVCLGGGIIQPFSSIAEYSSQSCLDQQRDSAAIQ